MTRPTGVPGGWRFTSTGQQRIVAVDRFAFTFEAGRVTGDKAVTLQCKAVFPDGVKTKDMAIPVKETVPDPVFTLTAPAAWDGRATTREWARSFTTEP